MRRTMMRIAGAFILFSLALLLPDTAFAALSPDDFATVCASGDAEAMSRALAGGADPNKVFTKLQVWRGMKEPECSALPVIPEDTPLFAAVRSNPNPEDSGDSSGPKKPGPGSGPKGGGAEPQGDGKKKPGGSGGGIEGDWRQEGPAGLNKGGSGSGSGKPGSNHGDGGDWSGEGPQGFKPRHGEGSAKRVGGTDPMEPVTCPSCSATNHPWLCA